jgi:serine/threonine-protein kinase
MADVTRCPNCGAERPSNALEGLCPRCLLKQGLEVVPAGGCAGNAAAAAPLLPDRAAGPARYQLLGEIARGGMGSILKGHDPDLGRDLAVKVLLEAHVTDPDTVRRFIEEAQIGGQLQHPGIVPVYEVGTFSDRRPYFTMKLVEGRTLAALLDDRPDPAHDLPRFLQVFLQVCQTMAYAHSQGVLHRDLKPANVMVGAFGEVQVMDWGLAKVVQPDGTAADEPGLGDRRAALQTARTGPDPAASWVGSVMGTPAYMPPEQARGEVGRIDKRSDVFALGAILCEILTGLPPYCGPSHDAIRRQAATADMAGLQARLETCGADAELRALVGRCLATDPADRPRDAGALEQTLTAYLASVQDRLKAAELARVELQARAAQEQSKRRLAVGLAAAVMGLVVLAAGGSAWIEHERRQRNAANAVAVNRALDEATLARGQARAAAVGNLAQWNAASAALAHAQTLLDQNPADAGLRARFDALRAGVAREGAEARARADQEARDRQLVERLAEIRSLQGDEFDPVDNDRDYATAFKGYGLDVVAMDVGEVARRIAARPPAVALELTAGLDDWALGARARHPTSKGWRRLLAVARAADPDPDRDQLRGHLLALDRAPLETPAGATAPAAFERRTAHLLGVVLRDEGRFEEAVAVLRAALDRHPRDLWLNLTVADALAKLPAPRWSEAVRYYTVARSIRPELGHALAHALVETKAGDEAIAVFRDLVRRRPAIARHHSCLGFNLAKAGHRDEALAEHAEALRLQPDGVHPHYALGRTLSLLGSPDEAIAQHREALRLEPDYWSAHYAIGRVLLDAKHDYQGAIAAFQEALRHQPDDAMSHASLAYALGRQGRRDEAIEEFRRSIRLSPDYPYPRRQLGLALHQKGLLDDAIVELRHAIRLDPDSPLAHFELGRLWFDKGALDQAIVEFREAIRLNPEFAGGHAFLGFSLRATGDQKGALAELHRAGALTFSDPGLAARAARERRELEVQVTRLARLPAVFRGDDQPVDAADLMGLARVATHIEQRFAVTARLIARSLDAHPHWADFDQDPPRYYGAVCATVAATERDSNLQYAPEADLPGLRKQALQWLRAELSRKAQQWVEGSPEQRDTIRKALAFWTVDGWLAGLREESRLARLPETEQMEWRALWDEVRALLKRNRGDPSP